MSLSLSSFSFVLDVQMTKRDLNELNLRYHGVIHSIHWLHYEKNCWLFSFSLKKTVHHVMMYVIQLILIYSKIVPYCRVECDSVGLEWIKFVFDELFCLQFFSFFCFWKQNPSSKTSESDKSTKQIEKQTNNIIWKIFKIFEK